MYPLLKHGGLPASYVSLPEGSFASDTPWSIYRIPLSIYINHSSQSMMLYIIKIAAGPRLIVIIWYCWWINSMMAPLRQPETLVHAGLTHNTMVKAGVVGNDQFEVGSWYPMIYDGF